jgi:hypothetical protein
VISLKLHTDLAWHTNAANSNNDSINAKGKIKGAPMAQNTKLMQMDKLAIRPNIVISALGVDEQLWRRCRELDCIVEQINGGYMGCNSSFNAGGTLPLSIQY